MSSTIEVRDVVKRYGTHTAVDGVSLDVAEGEFFGILGPNGAGKTTLLEIIEGLRAADSGSVTVLGKSPWPRNPELLPLFGVQLQASAFFEQLTAREQLTTFAALYGTTGPRIDEMLELVGLTEKAGTRAEKLSGGQAQRLSIACALVHDPQIVFLDEPSAALDPQARRNLWDVLRAINDRGKTVILTTHYMDEAQALCDRVAIMDNGKILELGSPADLIRGLQAPLVISVDHRALSADAGHGLPGAEKVEQVGEWVELTTTSPEVLMPELARLGALTGLQVRGAGLEDVFLNLTGREYRA